MSNCKVKITVANHGFVCAGTVQTDGELSRAEAEQIVDGLKQSLARNLLLHISLDALDPADGEYYMTGTVLEHSILQFSIIEG